jgi:hypothetical protein
VFAVELYDRICMRPNWPPTPVWEALHRSLSRCRPPTRSSATERHRVTSANDIS